MRYQQRIYIQNPNTCVRNKDIVNVSTSSDLCEFNKPSFTMTGADKIKTGTTESDDEIHIVSPSATTIDLTFTFTGNVQNFVDVETTFKYNIYRYNESSQTFTSPALFDSGPIEYESFSATSAFTDSILVSDLVIDGQYLIKGSYDFVTCTKILNELGDTNSTFTLTGDEFGLYDKEFDYYFAAIREASKPEFGLTPRNTTLGSLRVESTISTGGIEVTIESSWLGDPIVAVNGITLYEGTEGDFTTVNNSTVIFESPLVVGDVVTIAYVDSGNPNGLVSESSVAPNPIPSGATGNQGNETIYFNTDTNKYEVFLESEPAEFNDVILTLNGVTLANGLDYTQSATNPKKLVLNGNLLPSDIITVTYNTNATYVGTINTDNFDIVFSVSPAPTNTNGFFTAYVADNESFSAGTIVYTAQTGYVINEQSYTLNIDLSSYSGTTAFYKVSNQKNYDVLSGGTVSSITDSIIIPIEIDI